MGKRAGGGVPQRHGQRCSFGVQLWEAHTHKPGGTRARTHLAFPPSPPSRLPATGRRARRQRRSVWAPAPSPLGSCSARSSSARA